MFLFTLILLPFVVLVEALFIWALAKIADVEDATFKKSIIAAIGCTIAGFLSDIFSLIPIIGVILGAIVSIVLCAYIIKYVFDTDWGRAIIILILPVVTIILIALFLGR